MRISDWSSDVCSSDLSHRPSLIIESTIERSPTFWPLRRCATWGAMLMLSWPPQTTMRESPTRTAWEPIATARRPEPQSWLIRSEEHTSELQSLMRISYAVFCLKKKKLTTNTNTQHTYTHN